MIVSGIFMTKLLLKEISKWTIHIQRPHSPLRREGMAQKNKKY